MLAQPKEGISSVFAARLAKEMSSQVIVCWGGGAALVGGVSLYLLHPSAFSKPRLRVAGWKPASRDPGRAAGQG